MRLPLIEANVEATLMLSEITTFLSWIERLPDEQDPGSSHLMFLSRIYIVDEWSFMDSL